MRFEQTTTRHGSPLYVLPMPHVTSVAVGILVIAGTRDERWPSEAGIAHALEHMVFQGNDRLPDSLAIASEIEDCGGRINAWTDKEMTLYHRVVPSDAFHIAVRSLASQVSTPLFHANDIIKEMRNVVQEIKRADDTPANLCMRRFQHTVYGEHPLGKDTLGTEKSVTDFLRDAFVAFHDRLYYPHNYVFIAIGNVSLEEAVMCFDKMYLKAYGGRTVNNRLSQTHTAHPTNVTIARDIKQANVYTGLVVGSARDYDTTALQFFTTMISGGISFPMFQEVRNKRGLCYATRATVDLGSDHSVFSAYVGTSAEKINEALDAIHGVICASAEDKMLFSKARRNLLGKNAILFTSPEAILERAAVDITFSGRPKAPMEIREEIELHTPERITEAVVRHNLTDRNSYSTVQVVPHGTKI